MTRSPSWDEHISFSRVPWPTSRHQVNTLFQFQHSNSLTNWPRGLLNGSGLKFILQELVLLHKVTLTVEFLHQWHITQVTHTSPADVLMDTFKMSTTKTIKETKIYHSMSHAMFIYNHRIIRWIMNTLSSVGVTFLFNLWIFCSKCIHKCLQLSKNFTNAMPHTLFCHMQKSHFIIYSCFHR